MRTVAVVRPSHRDATDSYHRLFRFMLFCRTQCRIKSKIKDDRRGYRNITANHPLPLPSAPPPPSLLSLIFDLLSQTRGPKSSRIIWKHTSSSVRSFKYILRDFSGGSFHRRLESSPFASDPRDFYRVLIIDSCRLFDRTSLDPAELGTLRNRETTRRQ